MIRKSALILGLAATLLVATDAGAVQAMTVREFMTTADRIPRNPTAALRADTRRLIRVVREAVTTVKAEQAADVAAGRRPAHCIPDSGTSISAEGLLARFEAIPQARRNISVTQAIREWMTERHPCR